MVECMREVRGASCGQTPLLWGFGLASVFVSVSVSVIFMNDIVV